MVKQNIGPVKAEELMVVENMTLSEIRDQIAAYQNSIAGKKAVSLSDAVKAAKRAYQALSSQGIAMPSDVFVESLKDLSDDERKTLSAEIEGGLKPQSFEEYAVLDYIRNELIAVSKTCNYKKSGRTSTGGGDRKVRLSNFTCICPVCDEVIGNPEGCTQKHLVVNQMRLHMLNKHNVEKEQFNKEYRAIVNANTYCTKDVIEEIR